MFRASTIIVVQTKKRHIEVSSDVARRRARVVGRLGRQNRDSFGISHGATPPCRSICIFHFVE